MHLFKGFPKSLWSFSNLSKYELRSKHNKVRLIWPTVLVWVSGGILLHRQIKVIHPKYYKKPINLFFLCRPQDSISEYFHNSTFYVLVLVFLWAKWIRNQCKRICSVFIAHGLYNFESNEDNFIWPSRHWNWELVDADYETKAESNKHNIMEF